MIKRKQLRGQALNLTTDNSEIFINGQGLTNGPDQFNGNDLTSLEWKLDDENQLEKIESVGLFRRFYRRLKK